MGLGSKASDPVDLPIEAASRSTGYDMRQVERRHPCRLSVQQDIRVAVWTVTYGISTLKIVFALIRLCGESSARDDSTNDSKRRYPG
jgi:hypothetical protein